MYNIAYYIIYYIVCKKKIITVIITEYYKSYNYSSMPKSHHILVPDLWMNLLMSSKFGTYPPVKMYFREERSYFSTCSNEASELITPGTTRI